jgi:hypothetical protein
MTPRMKLSDMIKSRELRKRDAMCKELIVAALIYDTEMGAIRTVYEEFNGYEFFDNEMKRRVKE